MSEVDTKLSAGVGFIDGVIVPISQARIPIMDLGFLHSDATYDVVHVWNHRFFRLDDHLDRFMDGMAKLHMTIEFDRSQIRQILRDCVRASGLKDAYVEMICTRGVAAPNSRDPRLCKNAFYAFVVPFAWIATPDKQDAGLSLYISSVQRIPPQSIDPTIKNYHWLDLVRGQYDAYDAGSDIAVLTDSRGNVLEGAGFNIFAIRGDHVATPSEGVLQGVTRKTAIELLPRMGLTLEERTLTTDEVLVADEVFITSTAGGIMPIKFINGRLIGSGLIDKTLRLRKMYWDAHLDPEFSEPV